MSLVQFRNLLLENFYLATVKLTNGTQQQTIGIKKIKVRQTHAYIKLHMLDGWQLRKSRQMEFNFHIRSKHQNQPLHLLETKPYKGQTKYGEFDDN